MKLGDVRNDGKYIDLWSVNHFLSGIVYSGWMFEWGFSLWFVFISYFVLAVLWELYELYAGIFEHLGNKVMDVVTGVIGFFLIFLTHIFDYKNLLIVTAIYIILELYCYIDYQLRGKHQPSSNILH
ncbi:MAG: hypothetical protein V4467_02760 [Patescibacteria group bacterium]